MDKEIILELRKYVNELNRREKDWEEWGRRGGQKPMNITYFAHGIHSARRIEEARRALFRIFPELQHPVDGNFYGRIVRDFLEQQDFEGLESTYFTGWNPVYKIHTSARELFSQGMWTPEKQICVGIPSFHKYLPGIRGYLRLKEILNNKMATSEEVEAERIQEQERWRRMSFDDKKERVQYAYGVGLEVEAEDIRRYNIKTID